MTPVLSDEQMKETVSKFEKIMLEHGCEIIHQENWGMRKLAYPISKKSSGFYHLFEFKAEGSFVKELEIQYKRDERVMRSLTYTGIYFCLKMQYIQVFRIIICKVLK
jgi:small subunit ribosomal protein S6